MRRDTTKIATEALEFYNNKEGTNFVLRKPLLSRCNLFPGTLVIHANFTTKNIVHPAVLENNSPSQLFFSETLKVYRQPTRILNCLIIDKCSSDIRTGCAHCPSHMCDRIFYHPPLGNSDYGEDEEKDHARFDYDESTTSSESDDDE
ncbi:unnamed protein product [Linum trigynum]|uniref:DUF3615 domain-containing protein n=1 Tax=Linum trigynum TaxID=586398 RepID=A0AAV2C6B4_9ROSI